MFEFFFKYRPVVFRQGDLVWQSPLPVWLLALAGAVLIGVAVWSYVHAQKRLTVRDRVLLASLRGAAVAVLVFALARPVLVIATVVPQQNVLGILIDDSRSMQIADRDARPRSAFVSDHFGPEGSALLTALQDRFLLRFFRFSETTQRMNNAAELSYGGARTDLAGAIDRARMELSAVPLAGLVLVTDGADNGDGVLSETLLQLKADGIPVHAVGVGAERFERDIGIARVEAPRRVLEGSSVAVDLTLAHSGFEGRSIDVFVEDRGRILTTRQVTLPRGGEAATVRVHFTAEESGARQLRFRVAPQAGEIVLQNNVRDALIQVDDAEKRVLYFEGEPRWEVGFLRRAIQDDENVHVVTLQRTAENKFLRLGIADENELAAGFPDTRQKLFQYDGLILGSVEASFFTPDQLRMIAEFVSVRGGGLLALGGRFAFSEGGYSGTPVAEALPVELTRTTVDTAGFFSEVSVSPTPFGASHPVMQLWTDDAKWNSLPALSTRNLVREVKPGATTLLTGRASGGPVVVLAYQRYGRGKSIAFVVQDSWMWQMHADIPLEDLTHETLWRQLLRWLVDGVPDRVTAVVEADRVAPNRPMQITAQVTDSGYLYLNGAEVVASITTPAGVTHDVPLEWTVSQDGEYRASFTPSEQGLHEINVGVRAGGAAVGAATTSVDVGDLGTEFFAAEMQANLLRQMADETGGRFYTTTTVGTLPEDVSFTKSGTSILEERDLWNMPIVFLLLLTLIGIEWTYRRQRGLA